MKTNEIRQKYLDFFSEKGHTVCPSDVLVPKWDPTVLFTPAGMNQFKDHFLGNVELEFSRAASCQKCLRTGDIDNVGRTAYHHTFFEMLGNFSFGDYFKKEAIHWAWEFLTAKKWMGIDPDRLTVTIYKEDEQAGQIWQNEVGLAANRISREGEDENFWPAEAPSKGPDGVCGPCSEIYYTPDDGQPVEIWNLVFTQFNRIGDPPENLHPLPHRNIDTGMGLERIAAVMQGVQTNYHIDSLRPLVEAAGEICGEHYDPLSDSGRRLRRIADHVRACTIAIHENTNPGAKAESSVIRTLMRRAVLDGYQLGLREAFVFQLVPGVVELFEETYPELNETVERVQNTMNAEEAGFLQLVESGIDRVTPMIKNALAKGETRFSGQQLFELHTSHGVPIELTEKLALDAGLTPDRDSYNQLMKNHGGISSTGEKGVMGGGGALEAIKNEAKLTRFVGYSQLECNCQVLGIVDAENRRLDSAEGQATGDLIIILDQTPFYAESGGQVGDCGYIESANARVEITDTQKDGDVFKHLGRVTSGELNVNDQVIARVDETRRDGIRRAHSATHILHFSLQKHLGSHAQQQGSKVENDAFRFDYSNPDHVSDELLLGIEQTANDQILAAEPITADVVPLAHARQAGAMMLFGEKYPDPCRMISMGEFSRELCGGTHLDNTGDVGPLEIRSDSKLAAGVRRIEVFTGERAKNQRKQIRASAEKAAELLQCDIAKLPDAVQSMIDHSKHLKKQLDTGKREITEPEASPKVKNQTLDFPQLRQTLKDAARRLNVDIFDVVPRIENTQIDIQKLELQLSKIGSAGGISVDELIAGASESAGIQIITAEIPGGNPNLMRSTIDQIRKKVGPVAILLAAATGESKVILVAGISRELVAKGLSAGEWVKNVAPVVGGGGGGKPDMAQAGGKNPAKIPEAMEAARNTMAEMADSKD